MNGPGRLLSVSNAGMPARHRLICRIWLYAGPLLGYVSPPMIRTGLKLITKTKPSGALGSCAS